MDLWVRSQDKMLLTKVDNIDYNSCNTSDYGEIHSLFVNTRFNVGEYATKERCLEILDDIQEVIENLPIFVKGAGELTKEDMEKVLLFPIRTVCYNDNVVPLQTLVYQMPEK